MLSDRLCDQLSLTGTTPRATHSRSSSFDSNESYSLINGSLCITIPEVRESTCGSLNDHIFPGQAAWGITPGSPEDVLSYQQAFEPISPHRIRQQPRKALASFCRPKQRANKLKYIELDALDLATDSLPGVVVHNKR